MFNIGSLSKYLLIRVLFYSVLLSLLTSVVNGWLSYQAGLARQQLQVQSVLAAYQFTLTKAVWELDLEAAQEQLQGLSRFPAVLSARIISPAAMLSYQKSGANQQQKSSVVKTALRMPNSAHELAMLEISLDSEILENEVWSEARRFTLIVSGELLLLSLLLFVLLRRHISVPIQALSQHVKQMNEARLTIAAPEPSDKPRHELHDLAEGITRLQYDLIGQFSLRDAAAQELAEHRDRLNQVLLLQEHQLDIVLHTMADGGAVLDGQGQILFVNPAWCRLMNDVAAEQLIGCNPPQWLYYPSWQSLDEQLQASDSLLGESLLLRQQDEDTLPVEASFSVLERHESGAPSRIQVMVRDLTARLETERVLVAAKETALQASQTKSAFLANMSHEIRTPLNAVLGFASLLADSELDVHQRQYIHNIHEAGSALLTLLNDILDFSKIEAGQLTLENIEFDLRNLLEDTQDIVTNQAQLKGLELVCLIDAAVPVTMMGDPGRLRQIVLNLLNNSVKFTGHGEIITRASVVARAGQQVRLRVEVKDQGIGISPEIQQQLFQPFQQADVSTTRRFGGTGLGLSICRRLASAMQGDIGVVSQVGEGALFWFEVNLTCGKPSLRSGSDLELAGKTVLVMSPLAGNRQKLQDDLHQIHCETVLIDDETSLIALLHTQPAIADAIVIDLPLAREIALDLPARIHAVQSYQDIPVLLSVTQGAVGQGALAEKAGYSAYLSKPIHFEALKKCLAEALHQRDQQPDSPLLTLHRIAELEALSRNCVLLVEDNVMNQKVGVLLLEKLGCRVDVANNGLEALEAVSKRRYNLVLMDCQMPELDGFDTTLQIRQLGGEYAQLPIVALTANAFAEDGERCLAVGMNDFMTKPIQIDALAAMLKKWIISRVSQPARS